MANVNISVQNGSLMVVPWTARVSTGNLKIIWSLAAAGSWSFPTDPPGIVCDRNPPPDYDPWDGTDAVPGPGPNQYNATAAPNSGPGTKTYKYDIHLVSGSNTIDVDPEIMNDPPPVDDVDPEKPKKPRTA